MKRTFFSSAWNKKFWLIFVILINGLPIISWGQVEGEAIAEELERLNNPTISEPEMFPVDIDKIDEEETEEIEE